MSPECSPRSERLANPTTRWPAPDQRSGRNEYDTWLVRDEVNFHRIGHDRTHSTLHGLTDDCVVPIAGAAPSEPVIDTTAVKTT